MHRNSNLTRRRFIVAAAGAAAGPIALASGAAAAKTSDGLGDRVAELEDRAALRSLHERLVAHVNAGRAGEREPQLFVAGATVELDPAVRRLDADGDGHSLAIDRAPDGRTATLRVRHKVRSESRLRPDCTDARMAIAQGCGIVRSSEVRRFRIDAAKTEDGWKVRRFAVVNDDSGKEAIA